MASTMRFDTWENPTATKTVTIDQIAGGSGLVPVVPSSVVVGSGTSSVGTNGAISFTGASFVRLNGAFTSAYASYHIIFRPTLVSAGVERVDIRLSVAGVDTTSSSYKFIVNAVDTSGTYGRQAGSNGGTSASLGYFDGTYGSREVTVMNPQTAQRTVMVASGIYDNGSIVSQHAFASVTDTVTYDGINLYPLTGTFTGTIQVYGYR